MRAAVTLGEKRKNFNFSIIQNVERRLGVVLSGQNVIQLFPCHELLSYKNARNHIGRASEREGGVSVNNPERN